VRSSVATARLTGFASRIWIRNNAIKQRQLDMYGEMVNALYESARYEGEKNLHKDADFRRIMDYVSDAWKRKDSSICEKRGKNRHFVYSKLMCWVALDREIKLMQAADSEPIPEKWNSALQEIRSAILDKGFSLKRNSFIQAFDNPLIDATALLIPLQEFLPPDDYRVVATVETVMDTLLAENGLVYRHEHDKTHSFFLLCTFWLIKVLAISQKVEASEQLFANVVNFLSPVGYMSEEIDTDTREFRGNFPQAFSHIGLINAALYIGVSKGNRFEGPKPLGIWVMRGKEGKNGSGTGSV